MDLSYEHKYKKYGGLQTDVPHLLNVPTLETRSEEGPVKVPHLVQMPGKEQIKMETAKETNFDTIENMIENVTTERFKIPITAEYQTIESKPGAFEDPTREFKDLATEIVVKEFINKPELTANYIITIVEKFTKTLNIYRQKKDIKENELFFVYKGGNVLRLVARQFLENLPGEIEEFMDEKYGMVFKRSDADFSIYINPKLDRYDEIFKDMTMLSYQLLVDLRKIFKNRENEFFEFHRYNEEYKKTRLDVYLKRFNETDLVKKKSESEYFNIRFWMLQNRLTRFFVNSKLSEYVQSDGTKKDMFITFDENKNTRVYNFNLEGELPSDHYISINETLKFEKFKDVVHFNLVRMKMNFVVGYEKDNQNYTMNVGGEMIDVSIPHKNSTGLEHFFENVEKNIHEYKYSMKEPIELNFKFKSYSFEYLIYDLENILFKQSEVPWDDRKYAKRVNRLLFLYLIDLQRTDIPLENKKAFIENLADKFYNSKMLNDSIMDELIFSAKKNNLLIRILLEQVKRIIGQVDKESQELEDFFKTVNENLLIMLDFFKKFRSYLDNPLPTEGPLDVQMGGQNKHFYKQYQYYKSKYLKHKKNLNK